MTQFARARASDAFSLGQVIHIPKTLFMKFQNSKIASRKIQFVITFSKTKDGLKEAVRFKRFV